MHKDSIFYSNVITLKIMKMPLIRVLNNINHAIIMNSVVSFIINYFFLEYTNETED